MCTLAALPPRKERSRSRVRPGWPRTSAAARCPNPASLCKQNRVTILADARTILTFPRNRTLDLTGRTAIVGILNVTPDSFSDGGEYLDSSAATDHALRMTAEGAEIIDVGPESTRPGSADVDAGVQRRRAIPVIEHIGRMDPQVFISIDTRSSEVARAALDAGADIINDVSAGGDDPAMLGLAAERCCPIVLMHMRGTPATMQRNPIYDDVVKEVCTFLCQRRDAAVAAGVPSENILLDPGIGFGKTTTHNLQLMADLSALVHLGQPIMLGPSRKRFLGEVLGIERPADRLHGTLACVALAFQAGVHLVRVHDVAPAAQLLATLQACRQHASR
jgi:dihydropteroate synthase